MGASSLPATGGPDLRSCCRASGQMAAHQRRHRPPQRAVSETLLHVGELRIEPLRVTDRELEAGGRASAINSSASFSSSPIGFSSRTCLRRAGSRARTDNGLLGRGGHDDGIDVRTAQEFAIVGRALRRPSPCHLLEPVTVNLAEVQALDQGMSGTRAGPEPPIQPTPMMPMLIVRLTRGLHRLAGDVHRSGDLASGDRRIEAGPDCGWGHAGPP